MLVKILKSPITLFISILVGIIVGFFASGLVPVLSVFSNIYISLLQVCAIPIVICAIIINIGRLFQKMFRGILFKWVLTIVVTMILVSLLGIGITLLSRSFIASDVKSMTSLLNISASEDEGKGVTDTFSELSFYDDNGVSETSEFTITDFLIKSVPSNIFKALTENNTIQVLIFSCILGITVAFINKKKSEPLLSIAEGVYAVLCKFIDYLMVLLPIFMCSVLAESFSNEKVIFILSSLTKYIALNYIIIFVIVLMSFIIIVSRTKCTFRRHLLAIKRTFFVSIATSSCLASTLTLIEDIPEPLGLDEDVVRSIMPVENIFCQAGTIAATAILATYSTTIYDVPIDMKTIVMVLVGSIVFALSIAGVPGMVGITMLSIVFQPLGVPEDLMTVIFMSALPFYQGLNVFASLYSNIAITTFVLKPKKQVLSQEKGGDGLAALASFTKGS